MIARTFEDALRAEYFDLLPYIRRAADEIEAEVKHLLVTFARELESHERIVVKVRIKDCESAIGAVRRRPEFFSLEGDNANPCSLQSLNDLAGVRILAFPKRRVLEINEALRARFAGWTADPVPGIAGSANSLAFKYHGYCSTHCRVRTEIQLMSMLVGMFWEVEHAALYKPGPRLRSMDIAVKMQHRYADVISALSEFESEFEALVGTIPSKSGRESN